MDGFEVLAMFAISQLPHLPIPYMVTSRGGDKHRTRATKLAPAPFDPNYIRNQLMQEIRQILENGFGVLSETVGPGRMPSRFRAARSPDE